MWYPSLMSTLSHPHPYSSIWLLSATLCMLRAPNYFHAAAGNAHTSDVVLFDLSAAVNNRPLIYSWKVMFPWHHSHLILLIPPGHLFQSLSLDLLLFPELKLLQLCPGLCLHNCFMSSHVILQLSTSYMLILCFSLAFFFCLFYLELNPYSIFGLSCTLINAIITKTVIEYAFGHILQTFIFSTLTVIYF